MRWRGWLGLVLLAPVALVALGTQLAATTAAAGGAVALVGGLTRDSGRIDAGVLTLQRATGILDWTWSSPGAFALSLNPITLGAVDDLAESAHAVDVASGLLAPLAEIGTEVLGFDGAPPMVSGTTIDTARIENLADPVAEVHDGLEQTGVALALVAGHGPLGRPIGMVAASVDGAVSDLAVVAGAATAAWPDLPAALGAFGTRRYLVCALNDAETFGSGGAPLSAFVVQAVRGTVSIPISGQLESKLSPDNPPIRWEHAGGPPWYRQAKEYPFVNSNFHPDFRTAAVDMQRAWAALGYPEVEGVVTLDVSALATILQWAGAVDSPGYGRVSHENLIRTLLVDAYRQFNSPEGVLERHARNDQLVDAILGHLTSSANLLPALRGTLDAIPGRHVQASFADPALQAAVGELAATGALADRPGDLLAVHSQSGPNKLSVFQERIIRQQVQLTEGGGAVIRRTISFGNAVPSDVDGDPTTYEGYTALLARMRVAYRLPLGATDVSISTGTSVGLVPEGRTGPFPDERGGQVLWQGHMTPPGEVTTVEMRYRLPDGTFPTGTYSVSADPQALPRTVALTVRVSPPPGVTLPDSQGWSRDASGRLEWSGILDSALRLTVG